MTVEVIDPLFGVFFRLILVMKRNVTDKEIQNLLKHPWVKHADANRVVFTFECRLAIWERFGTNVSVSDVRELLRENSVDVNIIQNISESCICRTARTIRDNGKPSRGKNKIFGQNAGTFKVTEEGNQKLLNTGLFVRSSHGITFSNAFSEALYSKFPEQSIEEGIIAAGLDPEEVGYQRIRTLRLSFEDNRPESGTREEIYSEETIQKYLSHPCIDRISAEQCRFKASFFSSAASLSFLHINHILEIFQLTPADFPISVRTNLRYRIQKTTSEFIPTGNLEFDRTLLERMTDSMNRHFLEKMERLKQTIPGLTPQDRKRTCEWIRDFPQAEDGKGYGVYQLLKMTGISKSSYYSILVNENYGKPKKSDEEDLALVREIYEYKGYRKGSRQVWMQLNARYPDHQMGLKKVRRLMKKGGMESGIRKASRSRIAIREKIAKNVKPNLIRRQFKMARPMTHITTDVTYLFYDGYRRAYKSSIKDAVTGKILGSVISKNNDAKLADDTLNLLEGMEFPDGAIFHSDQGILYLADRFQDRLFRMKFRQSMSRRGNCWDNACQESFFGHYKDEFDYRSCTTLEELQKADQEYEWYFNNERRMADRMGMTPMEYEAWLNGLDDEQFAQYLKKEQEKYDTMMANSAKKAIQRARDLGAELQKERKSNGTECTD